LRDTDWSDSDSLRGISKTGYSRSVTSVKGPDFLSEKGTDWNKAGRQEKSLCPQLSSRGIEVRLPPKWTKKNIVELFLFSVWQVVTTAQLFYC
jgi:hypothetical protein